MTLLDNLFEGEKLMFCSVIGFEKYASEVDFIRKWVGSRITLPYLRD